MGWIKKTKPGPIDLGTRHLDEITEPALYSQPFASRATKAQGYPFDGQPGILEVKLWRAGDGAVIAIYTASEGATASRSFYTVWRSWRDSMGRAVT